MLCVVQAILCLSVCVCQFVFCMCDVCCVCVLCVVSCLGEWAAGIKNFVSRDNIPGVLSPIYMRIFFHMFLLKYDKI